MGEVGVEELRLNFHDYLMGELWTLAVDDFIEMNSIYFEPGNANDSGNQKDIWKSYVSLVSQQIDYFLEVFGVSGSNLKSALQTDSSTAKINPDKLRQVLAGENTSDGFNLFVNLMISKRIALDRLTAEIMAEIANSESGTNATNGQGEAGKSKLAEISKQQSTFVDDEEAMKAVLKQSLTEYQMSSDVTTTSISANADASLSQLPQLSAALPVITMHPDTTGGDPFEASAPLEIDAPVAATLSLQREASTLMVHNLKQEEFKAKERLEKNPFAVTAESGKSSVSGKGETSDFISAQIHQAELSAAVSTSSSEPAAGGNGSKRFVDLRKQLIEKKAKMRDDKAEELNVPVSQRPYSARKHRTAVTAGSSEQQTTPSTSSTEASQTLTKDASRDKIRKNIFASVRQEIMDR